MAIKIINNSVINNDGTIVADKIRMGNVNNQPTLTPEILIHDGAGNARLQYIEIDTSTVTFSGSGGGGLTTDIVAEGTTNLYYTDARVDANFATKATTDLTEGTNLYYTDARVRNVLTADNIADITYVNQAEANAVSTANAYTDSVVSSGLGSLTTDDITEGTNLYYTDTRARNAISTSGSLSYNPTTGVISYTTPTTIASLSNHTTDALAEGTGNLYFTTARFSSHFDLNLLTKNTDDLVEGSTNLYYEDSRARNAISTSGSLSYNPSTGVISYTTPTTIASLSNHTTDALTEGTNLYFTNERVDDRVAALLVGGTNVTVTYDDIAGTLTIDAAANGGYDLSGNNTGDLAEGTNLYYTDTRARNAISTSGSLSYNPTTGVISYTTPTTIASLSNHTTDALAEGSTNLYYTDTRVGSYLSSNGYATETYVTNALASQASAGYDLSANSTDDLTEGSTNLYYTDTRANSAFDTRLATKTTTNLAEGTNLYYTTTRVNSAFDTRLATKTTTNLAEGTNLYYTDARVDANFATKTTSDLTEGTNLYYTTTRANSAFDTRLATKTTTNLAEGTNLYYTDARANSAFDTRLATKTTSDLTEGTNLYYTTTRANSAIDTRVTKSFVDALGVNAATVSPNSVVLGTSTTGNYIATISGTTNEITVSGSGTENAAVTIGLPSDVTISNNLTVSGDLYVAGSTITVGAANLSVSDNFIYLNQGDAIDPGDVTFTGTGVNDALFMGYFKGTTTTTYYVRIDSTGTPDTFEWSKDNFATTEATGVAIDGNEQLLDNGIAVEFATTTGHTLGDTWSGTAAPNDIDTGLFSNRNSGTTGPGYTHQGIFYDVSTSKWRIFSEYDNEPNGDIDTSHASYVAGTLVADTFEGNLTGNANTATTLATARTISLAGDVTGSASFNGGSNITITATVADDSHNHTIANVDGLQTALDGKLAATANAVSASKLATARTIALAGDVTGSVSFDGSANATITTVIADDSHNHTIANVDGLQTALDAKLAATANAVSASKLATARTISLAGDATGSASFDGSANASITVTIADDSHNHVISNVDGLQTALDSKLNLTGGTLTGNLTLAGAPTVGLHAATKTYVDDAVAAVAGGAVTSADKWTTARTLTLGGDATGNVSIDGSTNVTLTVTVLDDSHNHTIANIDTLSDYTDDLDNSTASAISGTIARRHFSTGDIAATSFTGALNGNASTATKLATARTISLAGDATGSASFDGSANATITVVVADDSHNHIIANVDGLQTALDSKSNTTHNHTLDSLSNTTITSNSAGEILKWNGSAWINNTLAEAGIQPAGSYLGSADNAVSASKWATARTISLAGDATGSASFDGSANVTLTVAVADDSHNHTIANVDGLQTALDAKLAATANAVSASKLATARTIALAGDATGSASFDGSANATITVVVANDSHTHDGRYYTETEADSRFVNVTGDTMTGSLTIGTIVGTTGTLNVTGNITATGEVTAYSDRRFKHEIVTIANALDKTLALRGVNYEKDDRYSMGVIAQEVESVIPEVVYTDAEGMKSVAYGNMVGLLIEAVKEQQKQIADLQKRLDELQK